MGRRTDKLGAEERRYLSESEMAELLDAELLKPARRMDMDLIIEGLDYFEPFDAEADAAAAKAALERFLEKYPLFREEGKRKSITRKKKIVLVAAIILVLLLGVCSALGVWKVAYEWLSDSLFMHITSEGGGVLQPEEPTHRATEIWGDELYDLMDEYGIELALPTWMPEEMELVYAEALEVSDIDLLIDAVFEVSEDRRILLSICRFSDNEIISGETEQSHYHEADYKMREGINYEGKEYHLFTNIAHAAIVWSTEEVDTMLTIPYDRELSIQIIESIKVEDKT